MIKFTKVNGTEKGDIRLFALSTCIWCRKTRLLLENLGVAYNYIYIDLIEGSERDAAMAELETWNPLCSYPTLVVNNKECIVGFKEDKIRETLKE